MKGFCFIVKAKHNDSKNKKETEVGNLDIGIIIKLVDDPINVGLTVVTLGLQNLAFSHSPTQSYRFTYKYKYKYNTTHVVSLILAYQKERKKQNKKL